MRPLEKLEEPASLTALRRSRSGQAAMVDLPELFLEIAARTEFPRRLSTLPLVHISERTAAYEFRMRISSKLSRVLPGKKPLEDQR